MMKINEFLKTEKIKYKKLDNYIVAFTHMSFVHESKIFGTESYERLEFLGDAVLGQIVTRYIYTNYPELPPGELTLLRSNLVNKNFLGQMGRNLNFEKYIQLGQGEKIQNLSDSVYEDVFESIVGAIYLDAGYDEAVRFVSKHILLQTKMMNLDDLKDHKTKLQEYLQSEKGISVTYKIVKQRRVNNTMNFTSQVLFDNQVLGSGNGLSKKAAEQMAAKDAYNKMAVSK